MKDIFTIFVEGIADEVFFRQYLHHLYGIIVPYNRIQRLDGWTNLKGSTWQQRMRTNTANGGTNIVIIDADDDILFPKDLIESRLKDFENNGKKYCISSNTHLSVGFKGKMRVVSAMSLFQKKMFNRWEKFYTPAIIATNNDDRTYLTIMWLNGYLTVGCTKWSVHELLEKYDMSLNESSLTSSKLVKRGRVYDRIAQNEFLKISSKSILDSFGYW